MAFILSGLLNWLRSLFFAKHLEVTIVGLQVSLLHVPSFRQSLELSAEEPMNRTDNDFPG
jgi:ADP-ribosylation factor-like protein 8